jgi:hypothetical protein
MWNIIVNPKTGRKVDINGRIGQRVFKKYLKQMGGGKCGICKSPGVTKSTCPLNPKAKNPNPKRHPMAVQKQVAKVKIAKVKEDNEDNEDPVVIIPRKKIILVIKSTYDNSNAFPQDPEFKKSLQDIVKAASDIEANKQNPKDIVPVELVWWEVSSIKQIEANHARLLKESNIKSNGLEIMHLIIMAHGTPTSIEIGPGDEIIYKNSERFDRLTNLLGPMMMPGADIFLHSCSTGKGKGSFAQSFANKLDRNVQAADFDIKQKDLEFDDIMIFLPSVSPKLLRESSAGKANLLYKAGDTAKGKIHLYLPEPLREEKVEWSCHVCTFNNNISSTECEICNTPRQ